MADPDDNGFALPRQTPADRPRISVVVPVYCEEAVLKAFYDRAKKTLTAMEPQFGHELIFVNDGSTDSSGQILAELARTDQAVRVISFARNFGHQLAITAGLDHASGSAAVVIDADLQDPPEVIPEMVGKWQEGFKVVYGVREIREGETRFKLWTARAFYRLLSFLSDTPLPVDSGDFRLVDRAVIDALGQIREESRYLRGLVSWVGFAQYPLPYRRDVRYAGTTKFPLRKMFKFALDGISSFSEKPLRLSGQLGFAITFLALVLALWIIIGKLTHPKQLISGWASGMVAILFMGGVELLCIGILGEYVGRIFRQTKGRPLYIVAERINVELHRPSSTAAAVTEHEAAR